MEVRMISMEVLNEYREYLIREEKSALTVEKYLRDVNSFFRFTEGQELTKETTMAYKKYLEDKYAVRSVNSMLAAMNNFLIYMGWDDLKVKVLRCQKQSYSRDDEELTKAEYLRLIDAAKGQPQLQTIMQTICGTGIRVSELKYFTVEAVRTGEISVYCKGKIRTILIPGKLRKRLLDYAGKRKIRKGNIFITKNGKPVDRSNIWAQMKRLCENAAVNPKKVFPHNLRKLFARTFYGIEKDIAKLADILGHNSIETTRIYIITTGVEHRKKIERLGLVV